MNKKTKTYLLLATVVCIWGFIGFKIIHAINPEAPKINEQEFNVAFNPKKQIEKDTFAIQKVTKDPFLGTLTSNKKKKTTAVKAVQKATPEIIPNITYGGLIKKQSAPSVFVVNINNKEYLLKKGQTADNVKLIKGNTKEITVRFNKKTQTIPIR